MATYISFARFTDQGIRTVRDTVKRADAAKEMAAKFGVSLNTLYWTHGDVDIVAIVEAKDDAAATAFSLAVSAAGNVRFETHRALSRDEMLEVLQKLPQA